MSRAEKIKIEIVEQGQALEPRPAQRKQSIASRIVKFLSRPDLDMETFKRIEGVECEPKRTVLPTWRML